MCILDFDKSHFIPAAGISFHAACIALIRLCGHERECRNLVHAIMYLQRESGGNAEVKNRHKKGEKSFHAAAKIRNLTGRGLQLC